MFPESDAGSIADADDMGSESELGSELGLESESESELAPPAGGDVAVGNAVVSAPAVPGPAIQKPAVQKSAEPLANPLAQDLLLNPTRWGLWSAVSVLRWVLRSSRQRGLIYRSRPSLSFPTSEVYDVALDQDAVSLTITAPGIASFGSALPISDIARIVADTYSPGRGALIAWLDGPGDRFMQTLESAKARYSAAFSVATGSGMASLRQVGRLSGHSAPLWALPEHRLQRRTILEPEGAAGLGAYFVNDPSAHGLSACLGAFTGLSTRVEEFAGARVRNIRPARMGAPLMRMLGVYCTLPAAGVRVILDGGSLESARRWAGDPGRQRSLQLLCERYIGNVSITAKLFLDLDPQNTEPATLGESILGGMAVLGVPFTLTRLPLRAVERGG